MKAGRVKKGRLKDQREGVVDGSARAERGDVDGFAGANGGGERGDALGGAGFEHDADALAVVDPERGERGVEIAYGDDFTAL